MIIDVPQKAQLPALRSLWKEAFGDTDEFLNAFEQTAFAPERCRLVTIDDTVAAALYWFDCSLGDRRIAYLYAIATACGYRGRGICSSLMKDTHRHLKALGYQGAILVPGSEKLFEFYKKLGYQVCSHISEISCLAASSGTEVKQIDECEYAILRRRLLPQGGVVQENENLKFLKKQAAFYAGDGFLLAARGEADTLYGLELLGNKDMAPAVVQSLGYDKGVFRVPGNDKSFAMYYPLGDENIAPPSYFGLAFD